MPSDNRAELTAILQAVIDAPVLQPYYHPEVEGRSPLVLVTRPATGLLLTKFDRPVRVVETAAPGEPFLEISDVRQTPGGYTVEIRYAVEGITGRFDLSRDAEGRWFIRSHELNET